MERAVTMRFEMVENGLIVQKREGNKWGEKRWVVGFRDQRTEPFAGMLGGESVAVGEIVRQALIGPRPITIKSEPDGSAQ